jgi:hypothetical protein
MRQGAKMASPDWFSQTLLSQPINAQGGFLFRRRKFGVVHKMAPCLKFIKADYYLENTSFSVAF